MKKKWGLSVLIITALTCGGFLYYKRISYDLSYLIPKERCAKSAYSDESIPRKISINCRDYNEQIYTIILRKWKDKEKIDNISKNLIDGEVIENFICSEFKSSNGERLADEVKNIHACILKEKGITITSNSRAAIVFFINQFEKNIENIPKD